MQNSTTLPIEAAPIRRPLQLKVKKVVIENLTESVLRAQEPKDMKINTCDSKTSCCAC